MNKTLKILTLVSVFSLFLFGSSAFAAGWQNVRAGASYHLMGSRRFEATWLIGQTVNGRAGDYLGQISNLVIDQDNNRIALIVLSDVPGLGADHVAIPYRCLERRDHHSFTLRFPIMETAYVNNREDPDLYLLKQYPMDSPLYSIPQPINPNWVAEVYRDYGLVPPYWTEKGERQPSATAFYLSTQLIGKRVQATEGMVEPRVSDLIFDSFNGHITLLVLSDVEGRGAHLVSVPFDALNITDQGTFTLNVMRNQLASAPSFHRSDLNKNGYAKNVYRIFGLQPNWTEGGYTGGLDPYQWGGEAENF
jgi:sporulation protein YlmC with PRC-barrel domain